MSQTITCPACGASDLDVCCYDSMMVVRADLAMFTLRCPLVRRQGVQHADHTLPAARRGAVRRHRGGRGHGPRVTSRAGCAAGRARTRRVLPPTSQLRRSARQRNPMLNDIYWNLDPVLFSAGPFTVRWYGIAYVAGFVCAALLIWRLAKPLAHPRGRRRAAHHHVLRHHRRRGGRTAGIRAVLRQRPGVLPAEPARGARVQPRRHELPRRARGRAPRRHSGGEDDGHPVPHAGRPGLRGGPHRALLRTAVRTS